MSWGLVGVTTLVFFWDQTSIHAVIVMLIACGVRFIGTNRVLTASVAMCTCAVMIPSIIFLISDNNYIHTLIIASALTNAVPMLRFAINGHLNVLYSKF